MLFRSNGYDWQGRPLEVREDRFAGNFPPRGGFGGARGGFGGGFGARGGAPFGARGGFGGGFPGRGGFGGNFGGAPGGGNYDAGPVSTAPPNPFTDFATAGTDRNEIIYVRNVCSDFTLAFITPLTPILVALVDQQ